MDGLHNMCMRLGQGYAEVSNSSDSVLAEYAISAIFTTKIVIMIILRSSNIISIGIITIINSNSECVVQPKTRMNEGIQYAAALRRRNTSVSPIRTSPIRTFLASPHEFGKMKPADNEKRLLTGQCYSLGSDYLGGGLGLF